MVLDHSVSKLHSKHSIAEAGNWLHSASVVRIRNEEATERCVTSATSVGAHCYNMWTSTGPGSRNQILPPVAIEVT